jgi:hypothetical protein
MNDAIGDRGNTQGSELPWFSGSAGKTTLDAKLGKRLLHMERARFHPFGHHSIAALAYFEVVNRDVGPVAVRVSSDATNHRVS